LKTINGFNMASYLTAKAFVDEHTYGKGVFARDFIEKGEMVADFTNGRGIIVNAQHAKKMYDEGFDYSIQIGDDAFFVPTDASELEDGDYLNHSCDPNLGIRGSLTLVAMRDIQPNEHVTFDYAMSESAPYSMKCLCKSTFCRITITGDDWRIPALQKKYKGYFSDYLQEKINAI